MYSFSTSTCSLSVAYPGLHLYGEGKIGWHNGSENEMKYRVEERGICMVPVREDYATGLKRPNKVEGGLSLPF